MNKSAIIIGSSGLVGSNLVNELLDSPRFDSVIALVRKHTFDSHPKLKEIIFDFDNEAAIESLEPVNHIFCCLGTTIKKAGSKEAFRFVDYELPLRFAYWAEKTNANSFSVVTAMGANSNSSIFYNKVKGELEDQLKKRILPKTHIFQPSLIMGPRKELRIGEMVGKALMTLISPFMIGSLKKYRGIHAQTIAKGMVYHLDNSENGVTVFESDKI